MKRFLVFVVVVLFAFSLVGETQIKAVKVLETADVGELTGERQVKRRPSLHPNWPVEWVRNAIEQGADDLNAYRSVVSARYAVALAEGSLGISPVLMEINNNGKQEMFFACDDGDGDGYGKVYAYDSDWNLMWSEDVQGDMNKERLKGIGKKISIEIQCEKYFLFKSYGNSLDAVVGMGIGYQFFNNFIGSFECLYSPELSPPYLWWHPMDRVYYLNDVIFLKIGLRYKISVPYISVKFILCKATNVADFLNNEREYTILPLQLGIAGSIGSELNVWRSISVKMSIGVQKLDIREDEVKIYSLDGVVFRVGLKWSI